jgi:hypothetical protein
LIRVHAISAAGALVVAIFAGMLVGFGVQGSKTKTVTVQVPAATSTVTSTQLCPRPASAPPRRFNCISHKYLYFVVTDRCYSQPNGGILYQKSEGFTPGGTYTQIVKYPTRAPYFGANYTYLLNGGVGQVLADGSVQWHWDCSLSENGQPDPPGFYKLTLLDNKSGAQYTSHFLILPAQAKKK